MAVSLRAANELDVEVIAGMNLQLIQDEGSTNPMNMGQLRARILEWLSSGWDIDLLIVEERIVGYAVYRLQCNPFDDTEKEVYIRQYFINRDERQKGYGIEGVQLLMETRFSAVKSLIIDVLETNPQGKRFWEKAGFKPYCTNMRRALD